MEGTEIFDTKTYARVERALVSTSLSGKTRVALDKGPTAEVIFAKDDGQSIAVALCPECGSAVKLESTVGHDDHERLTGAEYAVHYYDKHQRKPAPTTHRTLIRNGAGSMASITLESRTDHIKLLFGPGGAVHRARLDWGEARELAEAILADAQRHGVTP